MRVSVPRTRWWRAIDLGRMDLAIIAFAPMATLSALHLAVYQDRPWALLALLAVPLAVACRKRPMLAASALAIGALIMRAGYTGIGYSDQLDLSQAAAARAFQGLNPYGVALVDSGAPYSYGPLGLVWWAPGVATELAGCAGILGLLVWQRAWLTLAVWGSFPPFVFHSLSGINDASVGFLMAGSLLVARERPLLGAAGIAVAAAIKPYALAWVLPLAGYGGGAVLLVAGGASAILWSPLALWGLDAFVRSTLAVEGLRMQIAAGGAGLGGGSIDLPVVRWMAVPMAAASLLLARDWRVMVLTGSAVYFLFLFFSPWTSAGYWIALVPLVGLALEGARQHRDGAGPSV